MGQISNLFRDNYHQIKENIHPSLWAGPSSESPIESSEVFKGFWHYSLPTGYSMEPREASNPPTTHLLKNKNLIQPR